MGSVSLHTKAAELNEFRRHHRLDGHRCPHLYRKETLVPQFATNKPSLSWSNIPGGAKRGAEPPFPWPEKPRLLEKVLARDTEFQGIGKAKASRLASAFGDGLHAALADKDPRVADVIGAELAAGLFVVYASKLREMDIVAWLSELDVDTRIALKIVRVWGAESANKLRRNPYLLIGFLGWRHVESIGRKLGIADDDPRRIVAAVEHALYQRLDEKHTLTGKSDLCRSIRKLLPGDASPVSAIDLAVQSYGAVPFGDGYQPSGAAAMESFVAKQFLQLADQEAQSDLVARDIGSDELERAIDAFDATRPYPLTERQREAVHMAVRSRIGFLGGYAGSGKTTVLRAICEVAERFGRVIHLMALSGRAAKRISEATERRATTIASFLKRVTERKDVNLGPAVILVIDEASMIDLPTLYRIMRHIGLARLLLVGDPAQLPPIGFGLTFHALIDHPNMPHVILDRVLRHTAESRISVVAEAIRNGRTPTVEHFQGLKDGVSFVPCPAQQAFNTIFELGRRLSKDGMERGECQIIAPVKAGPGGINALNESFHNLLTAGRAAFPGRSDIAEGDPIIWTQNDWQRDLQNGSMGRVLRINDYEIRVTLDEREIELGTSDGGYLDLAYSISVHKAQGSQWDCVIVPIYPSRLLDRTLLYTAVTRAARQVIFLGDWQVFERAVKAAPLVDKRETSLPCRLGHMIRTT